MKYEVIKEFPNSPKVGTVIEGSPMDIVRYKEYYREYYEFYKKESDTVRQFFMIGGGVWVKVCIWNTSLTAYRVALRVHSVEVFDSPFDIPVSTCIPSNADEFKRAYDTATTSLNEVVKEQLDIYSSRENLINKVTNRN